MSTPLATVPPSLTPKQWVVKLFDEAMARLLTIWASGILAAWALTCLTLSFNMVVGEDRSPIKSSEIGTEAEAWAWLSLRIAVGAIVIWLLLHRTKTIDGKRRLPASSPSTYTEEDKAKLKSLVTSVAVALLTILTSFLINEVCLAILNDWERSLGDWAHLVPLILAMALFGCSAYISPGIWYYLIDAIKRAVATPATP